MKTDMKTDMLRDGPPEEDDNRRQDQAEDKELDAGVLKLAGGEGLAP